MKKENKHESNEMLQSPMINGTMPHQISSPSFLHAELEVEPPFINKYGVVIGDSKYNSPNSPLNNWSEQSDPAIMAGPEWIHPTNDIGWNTPDNSQLLEEMKLQIDDAPFMHPSKDVSMGAD